MIAYKRGAMFGLDARIALAIFAGLAVIVGLTVYKAVQRTKATTFIAEAENITKGFIQYQLDTGFYTFDFAELRSSSRAGWKGPYLMSDMADPAGHRLYNYMYSGICRDDIPWTSCAGGCATVSRCFMWLGFEQVDQKTAEIIDNIVDGTEPGAETPDNGFVRYGDVGTPGKYRLYYKTSHNPRPYFGGL